MHEMMACMKSAEQQKKRLREVAVRYVLLTSAFIQFMIALTPSHYPVACFWFASEIIGVSIFAALICKLRAYSCAHAFEIVIALQLDGKRPWRRCLVEIP